MTPNPNLDRNPNPNPNANPNPSPSPNPNPNPSPNPIQVDIICKLEKLNFRYSSMLAMLRALRPLAALQILPSMKIVLTGLSRAVRGVGVGVGVGVGLGVAEGVGASKPERPVSKL